MHGFIPAGIVSVALALAVSQAGAEETRRELGSHEHGVSALNIAFEGNAIAMELEAPGADIVGFEHAAESAEDRAAIEDAIAMLAKPLELFVFPDAAGCTVTEASVELHADGDHDDHDSDSHHDDHDSDEHTDHDSDEHDDHDSDEHDSDEHADHDHDSDEHADHEDGAQHTEFHAEYLLNCDNPEAAGEITFAFFEVFENAGELDIQMISDQGTAGFEVERDEPVLDISEQI